jgi:metal-responsive CopG/Arc/MetJ family transcriptional regulator
MVRINAVLREDIVSALDEIAQFEHTNRSGLLRIAAERYIEEFRRCRENEVRRQRLSDAAAVQDRLREKSGDWDGVAEIRKWREML